MREDAEGGRPSAPEARVDALPLIQLQKDVVTEKMGAEVVFVHLRTNRIYTLNATAARAWELLSEGHSTSAVHERMCEEFDVSGEDLSSELTALIEALLKEELVEAREYA